ncbi:MAG: CHAT domain-containing protein [Thiothrix sp.]|uniref:nSTAND1 domain-containing NTPase n=1 Tax=Thiothrix sp. TaxID=1032 RepID=UPI00260A8411|nr:CHAT domain-containing protein [Thiothrix sp.]MDD5394417.1 CHAT domain-containing protein [Thiothrix sp.]
MTLPLILLTFANDKADYLSGIGKEMAQLETLLTPIAQRLDFELKLFPYTDSHALLDYLNANRERLVLLHFAGHSNSDVLQLDDGEWHIKGFAAKLGNCPHLRLVVLNGCQNAAQVHALRAANVAAVIGTHAPIGDKTATEFTQAFYHAFAEQALPLVEAFAQAHQDMETHYGSTFRSLDLHATYQGEVWAWFLEPHQATWKLADAASPCNRLPALLSNELPASPFKNLCYYESEDANIFFGRCTELLEVINRLNSLPADVLLIHGAAGIGKTSFLYAGLYPRLKANRQTVEYWRYNGLDPSRSVLEQIFGSTEPDAIRTRIDQPSPDGLPAIWIIDQMEEAFLETIRPGDTNAPEPPKLTGLLQILHQVFTPPDGTAPPRAKLVVTLRKEWFTELLEACRTHGISQIDYPLKPLNKEAIVTIICSPVEIPALRQAYRLRIESPGTEFAEEIADDLLTDKQSNIAPTLQIVLSRLWEKVHAADDRVWNKELYETETRQGLLLKNYLDQQLDKAAHTDRAWGQEAKGNGLLLDVLYLHISEYGTSRNINVTDYATLYPHISYLGDLIHALKTHNLLIEPYTHVAEPFATQTRLAHDSLAPVVARKFAASTLSGNRARRILNNRKLDWVKTAEGKWRGPLLDENDLQAINRGKGGTVDWNHDECETAMVTSSLKKQKRKHRKHIFLAILSVLILSLFSLFSFVIYQKYEKESPEIYTLLTHGYYLLQSQKGEENREKALMLTLRAASMETKDENIKHDIYRAMSYALNSAPNDSYDTRNSRIVRISNNQTIVIWNQDTKNLTFLGQKENESAKYAPLDWYQPTKDYMKFSEQGTLVVISMNNHKIGLWQENGNLIAELSLPEDFSVDKNHIDLSPQNSLFLIDVEHQKFISKNINELNAKTMLVAQEVIGTIPKISISKFTQTGGIMLLDTQKNHLYLFRPSSSEFKIIKLKTDYGIDYIRQISERSVLTWNRASATFSIHDLEQKKSSIEKRYDGHDHIIVNKNHILSYGDGMDATLWDATQLTPIIDRFFLPRTIQAASPNGEYLVFQTSGNLGKPEKSSFQILTLDSFLPEKLADKACKRCGENNGICRNDAWKELKTKMGILPKSTHLR